MFLLGACSSTYLPNGGPSTSTVESIEDDDDSKQISIVQVSPSLASLVAQKSKPAGFDQVFLSSGASDLSINPGDQLRIRIWEAYPQALLKDMGGTSEFPVEAVDSNGRINVPFLGLVDVGGLTKREVESVLKKRFRKRANEPQVIVDVVTHSSASALVLGDVQKNILVNLTERGERVLDAIALAGGVKQEIGKAAIQITRNGKTHILPFQSIISNPSQNIRLEPNDIVSSRFAENSFTVLGATKTNAEISFETSGISLSQALARAGGLIDERADISGVFIFRFEDKKVADAILSEGSADQKPIVYSIDLSDPSSFFAAKTFPVKHDDIVYVSNAPSIQLEKFLSIIETTTLSVARAVTSGQAVNSAFVTE